MSDNAGYYITVDRIEDGGVAVVVDDYQNEFSVPVRFFADTLKEGMVFTTSFAFDPHETDRRRQAVQSLIDELSDTEDGDTELL